MSDESGSVFLDLCCGGKKCPVWREHEDGTFSVEDDGSRVVFTREQLARSVAAVLVRLGSRAPRAQSDLHDPVA